MVVTDSGLLASFSLGMTNQLGKLYEIQLGGGTGELLFRSACVAIAIIASHGYRAASGITNEYCRLFVFGSVLSDAEKIKFASQCDNRPRPKLLMST